MSLNLIGNRSNFAIEYSVLIVNPSPPFGDCRLWLGGNCLGGLEGEVYLNVVCEHLQGTSAIKNQLFLEECLYNLSQTDLFYLMKKEQIDKTGRYWFMYTEGFDLFDNYVYRRNEMFYFIWKIREEYSSEGFSMQLFSAEVSISVYDEVVKQFKKELIKLYQGKSLFNS